MQEITKQPVLNIGMVGHIDHGKTTLLSRLSGKWTDTHSEELKRGITIKLGYADVVIKRCKTCHDYTIKDRCKCGGETEPVRYISFVDVPGHEMLMATMLSGAAIIDAAILLIAANEQCPRPQTKEHLVALEVKKIRDIIIVQNKVDLVSKEQALKNYQEIKNFVKGTIAENSPIIPCSAQQEINVDRILEEIVKLEIPERDTKKEPLFFIARSFDINRPGTPVEELKGGILGGILKQGKLRIGDIIEIKPGLSIKKHEKVEYKTLKTNILGLYAGNNQIDEAEPSGSLAIQTDLDPGITKADNLIGCVASTENKLPDIVNIVKIRTSLFEEMIGTTEKKKVEQIKMNEPLLLSINTSITVGLANSIQDKDISVKLKIPVIALKGSKAGIARNLDGHWRLIGWGEIV